MPFGLKNAPQQLMQKVLMGLNPTEGTDFVSVYLDDVIVFSDTFEAHLEHLQQVLNRFEAAGLKLKPSKCHFICQRVEYLGHIITPQGIPPTATESRPFLISQFLLQLKKLDSLQDLLPIIVGLLVILLQWHARYTALLKKM